MIKSITILALLLLSSCVTPSQSTVVERSKEQRPAWVELSSERSHLGDSQVQFHGLSDRVPDLPLGIKRTQISALEGSESGIAKIIRDRINEIGSSRRTPDSVLTSPEVGSAISDNVKRLHGINAKVADIYFERHQSLQKEPLNPEAEVNKAEHYIVHVLVVYPQDQIAAILIEIGKSLQRSRNIEVKRFGQTLLGDSSPVSH